MSLNQDEQKAVLDILTVVYGEWMRSQGVPTEETLALTEKLLIEIAKCNIKMRRLLLTIKCAIPPNNVTAKRWIRSCLLKFARDASKKKHDFIACGNMGAARFKTAIVLSFDR